MAKKPKEDTDTKNLIKRGRTWYIKRMVDGKLLVQSTGQNELKLAQQERDRVLNPYNLRDDKERAEAALARVEGIDRQLAKIENGVQATTILQGWQAYIDQHNRPDSGPTTLKVYEGWFEAFARWIAAEHPDITELRRVTPEHADAYAGHLLKRVSATTFNRHCFLLTLVWRILEKTARLSCNPWKGIERKRFTVHSRRELTVEELEKVFNAAQGEMRLLLALGTFCGLRLGDAACLEWGNVDMVKGIISLVPQKTARRSQKRVVIPIHRALYALLEKIPTKRRKGYVIPAMAARHQSYNAALANDVSDLFLSVDIKTNPNALTKSEKAARKRAKAKGVELPKAKPKGPRVRADCGFHSLRHTFVSLCAAGGVSQSVVQSLVGHGSPAMTQHYTHIGIETAQKAVALLPDVTKESDQTCTKTEHAPADLAPTDRDALVAVVKAMTAETWKADRDKLLVMLGAPV